MESLAEEVTHECAIGDGPYGIGCDGTASCLAADDLVVEVTQSASDYGSKDQGKCHDQAPFIEGSYLTGGIIPW